MQFRISIREAKALIWLAGAAAFVFASWTSYDLFTQKRELHYEPRTRDHFINEVLLVSAHGQPQSSRKPVPRPEECQSLWDCLIDGSVRTPDEPAEGPVGPAPPTQTVPPIDSIVQVGLIVWTADPARRFVAVTYKSGTGASGGMPPIVGAPGATAAAGATVPGKASMLHLSQGDPLEPPWCNPPCNGRILKIDKQEVTCRWGDHEVTITPSLGRDGTGQPISRFHVPPPEDDPAAALAIAPAETTKLKDGHWIIGSNDRERLRKDALQFLDDELNVRTITPAGGGFSSLELMEVKPGSLAAQVGAQDGDRILSINGFPMNSLSGAVNWFDQNPGQSQYVVAYERNGKKDSVTLHVK